MPAHPPRSRFRFDPAWLPALGLIGLLGLLHESLAPLRLLLFFFLVPTARTFRPKPATATDSPRPELPLPGPAARRGPTRAGVNLILSQALAILNPVQLVQQLLQVGGQGLALLRVRGRVPAASTYEQQVRYSLPVDDEWYIYNGGVTEATSHSWDIVAQRYACDLVIADERLQRHSGMGDRLTDYFCYGRQVRAAADGEVVAVHDGVRDAPHVGTGWLDWLARDFRGNSVTIRHAAGEYSFSAHLIPGSVTVKVGDRVARGQVIGRCGNSGYSSEPHLHFQVQDHPSFWLAVGLPVLFDDVAVDGTPAGRVYLTRGTRVRAIRRPA